MLPALIDLFNFSAVELEKGHTCRQCMFARAHENGRAAWCKKYEYPCAWDNYCVTWQQKEKANETQAHYI